MILIIINILNTFLTAFFSLKSVGFGILFLINFLVLILSIFFKVKKISMLGTFLVFWGIFIQLPSSLICIQNASNLFFFEATLAFSVSYFILHFFLCINYFFINLKSKEGAFEMRFEGISNTFMIIISIFSLFTIVYYFIVTPFIPLLSFSESADNTLVAQMREDSLKNLNIPAIFKYLIAWCRDFILPILISSTLIFFRQMKFLSKIFFCLVSILGFFFIASTTEKAPVSILIGVCILSYILINNIKFTYKFIFYGFLVALFPLTIYALSILHLNLNFDEFVFTTFNNFYNRLLYVPARVAMIHFEVFPEQIGFLNGASISGFNSIIGVELFNLPNYLYLNFNPFPDSGGNPTGYANASYISELWANFGWFGVFIGAIICGILFSLTDFIFYSKNKLKIICIPIYSCLIFSSYNIVNINLTTFLITKGFFLLVFLLIFMKTIHFNNLKNGNFSPKGLGQYAK